MHLEEMAYQKVPIWDWKKIMEPSTGVMYVMHVSC